MNNTQPNMLKFPLPLDNSKLHSPETISAWHAEHEQIYQHNRNTEQMIQELKVKQDAPPRPLSDAEYHAEAVEREKQKQAKEAEEKEAKLQQEKEKAEFLLTSPPTVQLNENNPHSLCVALNHWVGVRDYSIDTNSIQYFQNGFYVLNLLAPVAMKESKNA